MNKRKTLKFVKIKCSRCCYLNLVPVTRTFRVYETVTCENCGTVIATID